MSDPKSVINLGLGKIAASLVVSINPPKSNLEKHCANGYPTWKGTEISKRNWACCLAYAKLTASPLLPTDPVLPDGRVYKYAVPTNYIRALRDRFSEWEQRGKFIYSSSAELTIPYLADKPEAEWDPMLTDVVACRVAMECNEFATQSNTKEESAQTKYTNALTAAGRANAYTVGDQDQRLDDDNDEWTQARINPSSVGLSRG